MLANALALAFVPLATAHIAMWDKGMFGVNFPNQATDEHQDYNQNGIVAPLRQWEQFTKDYWFGHGARHLEPPPGEFLILPANGVLRTELACGRPHTECCGWPHQKNDPKIHYACTSGAGWGPLHTLNQEGDPNPSLDNLGGTAIAIVYESDLNKIDPNDMTVISVNYTSVWERVALYPMPALPPCPPEGCICTWNWYHRAQGGYVEEMYNTMFRCKVENAVAGNTVPHGQVPMFCENDPSKCVKGPKTAMYMYQGDGNNMDATNTDGGPPSYNQRYGFNDGAQHDAVISP